MEAHTILGPRRPEALYHEALEYEFSVRKIPFVSKPRYRVQYKEIQLKRLYIPDFMTFEEVVVELKSQSALTAVDDEQILNSLLCSHRKIGLLINFGEASLAWRRFAA